MNLIIVESPTKAKTIKKFLSSDYDVEASFGHVRDLPKSKIGVDVEKDFKPDYVVPTKSKKIVAELKAKSKEANSVILATDEDREGEAIAYHLAYLLKLKDPQRIVFHEITKPAIEEALATPRTIDERLVDAQQARRVLDRLVGYKLSPLLWRKVMRGLSAGRVQSVALRLICDREEEIKNFSAKEYWTIEANLKKQSDSEDKSFIALLWKHQEKVISKLEISSKESADNYLKSLEGAQYTVTNIDKKETKRYPLPPYTTSTLQQDAGQRLHFPAKMTMSTAQKLYEQGFITYHRTDSVNISQRILPETQQTIESQFGKNYFDGFHQYKTKSKLAQEAHEAIRPAKPSLLPDQAKLREIELKLYTLIWQRFMASQMTPALSEKTIIEITANESTFKAEGEIMRFDGYTRVYPVSPKDVILPPLDLNEILSLVKLDGVQHFTKPPARFSEPMLVKELEKNGVGRPSTYASIITVIQDRGYVGKDDDRRLFPKEIGIVVNKLLKEHFPNIVDVNFTSTIEEDLDKIAEGTETYLELLKRFYEPFIKNLKEKEKELKKEDINPVEQTDKICPKCGASVVIKSGRFGKFYSCSKFPECDWKESLVKKEKLVPTTIPCPDCKEGFLIERKASRGRNRGKTFYGCTRYPQCKHAQSTLEKEAQKPEEKKEEVK